MSCSNHAAQCDEPLPGYRQHAALRAKLNDAGAAGRAKSARDGFDPRKNAKLTEGPLTLTRVCSGTPRLCCRRDKMVRVSHMAVVP